MSKCELCLCCLVSWTEFWFCKNFICRSPQNQRQKKSNSNIEYWWSQKTSNHQSCCRRLKWNQKQRIVLLSCLNVKVFFKLESLYKGTLRIWPAEKPDTFENVHFSNFQKSIPESQRARSWYQVVLHKSQKKSASIVKTVSLWNFMKNKCTIELLWAS